MAWWQRELSRRPWWMNLVFAWCVVLAIGVPIEVALRPVCFWAVVAVFGRLSL